MAVTEERRLLENPAGRGKVFKGASFITEVDYDLQVFHDAPTTAVPIKTIITGSIRRVDKASVLWSTELLTLHLQDRRKLDFICVNYDPECEIASNSNFY